MAAALRCCYYCTPLDYIKTVNVTDMVLMRLNTLAF